MVSRGACSLSRSPRLAAPRHGRQQAGTQRTEPQGRSGPGPGVGEDARPGSPAPRGGCVRCPGVLGAGRPPGAAAKAKAKATAAATRSSELGRGGFAAGPRSHFVFLCKSHESGFPRAGAVMPAAAGRARAPLCSAERAAVSSRGGAAPVCPQHTHPTPRPARSSPPPRPRRPRVCGVCRARAV